MENYEYNNEAGYVDEVLDEAAAPADFEIDVVNYVSGAHSKDPVPVYNYSKLIDVLAVCGDEINAKQMLQGKSPRFTNKRTGKETNDGAVTVTDLGLQNGDVLSVSPDIDVA